MTNLVTPLTEETVRSLRLGDTVFVNGPIVTGRDEAHIRALGLRAEGKETPPQLDGCVLYHCGPIMRQTEDGWQVPR